MATHHDLGQWQVICWNREGVKEASTRRKKSNWRIFCSPQNLLDFHHIPQSTPGWNLWESYWANKVHLESNHGFPVSFLEWNVYNFRRSWMPHQQWTTRVPLQRSQRPTAVVPKPHCPSSSNTNSTSRPIPRNKKHPQTFWICSNAA